MKQWMILVGVALAAVAFGIVAWAYDPPDEELDLLRLPVSKVDSGDACRLVGYVWAWVFISEAAKQEGGPVGQPKVEPETQLLETLQANTSYASGTGSSYCRRMASEAAARAAYAYWTGEKPARPYQELLSDYWER